MSGLPDTVHALVKQQARKQPEAVYAIDAETGQELSYRQLAQSCRGVTALLRSCGLQPGDTVSLVMPNSLPCLQLLLGALWGGCCVNPVNLLSQPEQMLYVLEHSDCKLVLVSPEWEARVSALLSHIGRAITLRVVTPDAADWSQTLTDEPEPQPNSAAPALLMYTSGTTGRPKGVLLSQASLLANAWSISIEHRLGPEDRVLAVLPLYHINAFVVTMLAPLAHGGSLVLPARFSSVWFWPLVARFQCSWINLVPTMISYLLVAPVPAAEQTQRIRFCRSASAALPVAHLRAFEDSFGIGIIETMGLTETAAPAFSNPLAPSQRKAGSVGRASGGEARIVDAALAPLPDGEIGEITLRGPHLMLGYYKDAQGTQAAFTPDGWLRSGDLGYRDSEGFFFVTGRIKELIIKGGENIAPREIDEALLRHPAVLEAAAVGMPDPHYGQEILACVVLRPGQNLDEASLREFCRSQLGRYKTPRVFQFVSSLPRGPSGKVQRLKLLEELAPANLS
jgi:acyl-CoA synthetase (AMP-forming)/AMP-acid ligase II